MPDPILADDGATVRPFADFILEYRRGRLHHELSRALHDLAAEVIALERGGTLTLKLKVAHVHDLEVDVTADVTVAPPKPTPPSQRFYVDQQSNLTRSDPNQPALPGVGIDD